MKKNTFRGDFNMNEKYEIELSEQERELLKNKGKITITLYTTEKISAMEKKLSQRKVFYGMTKDVLEAWATKIESEKHGLYDTNTVLSYENESILKLEKKLDYAINKAVEL
ncbi:MAG: hypothetical protein FWD87_05045 [Spirochaetaceae bacterium]|nr:hypothetical protein [Spirochaetaceae bacterium]